MLIFTPKAKSGNQKKRNPMGTPQGQNTLVSLIMCAILGMVLSRILPFVIQKFRPDIDTVVAQEIGLYIALGISGVALVISLLRPRENVSPLRRSLLKEQEKSDGR